MRLDDDVWTPTPLGTIGPYGSLGDLTAGGRTSYRPLLRHHLDPGSCTEPGNQFVRVAAAANAWSELLDEVGRVPTSLPDPGFERTPTVVVGVVGPYEQLHAVLCAHIDPFDPRMAQLRTFWLPDLAWARTDLADPLLGVAFTALFRAVAGLGAVGVRVQRSGFGPEGLELLGDLAGFRPIAEQFAAIGMSASDAYWMINAWQATVERDRLDHLATRWPVDAAARRVLLGLIRVQLPDVPVGAEPLPPPAPDLSWRLTIGGEVALDGTTSIGTGDDRWGDAPPDLGEWSVALSRARHALARWLDVELASA